MKDCTRPDHGYHIGNVKYTSTLTSFRCQAAYVEITILVQSVHISQSLPELDMKLFTEAICDFFKKLQGRIIVSAF